MNAIALNDLELNTELDNSALSSILGGYLASAWTYSGIHTGNSSDATGGFAELLPAHRSMVVPVDVKGGFEITVWALIVTVVGGLGSVTGALLAGILLGIVYVIAADLIGAFMSLVVLLLAAAVTILIRPAGLLGVEE